MQATKDVKFTLIMSGEDKAMLEALAQADDRSAAAWIRATIKREYAEKFGGKPPTKTRPKR